MKKILALLPLLTGLALWADPAPTEDGPAQPNEAALNAARIAANAKTNAANAAAPAVLVPTPSSTRRARPGQFPAAPTATAAPAPAPTTDAVIPVADATTPPGGLAGRRLGTPAVAAVKPEEEMIGARMINLAGAELNQVLEAYATAVGRSVCGP